MHQLPKVDNRGVSLVELIAIISIMAILVGLTSLGVSVMFSRDAESVAVMVDDALSKTRMLSLSQPGEYTVTIHCDKDGNYEGPNSNYIEIKNDIGASEVGHYEEVINFKNKAYIAKEGTSIPLTADSDIVITFDKSNGSMKYVDEAITSPKKIVINCVAVKNQSKTKKINLLTLSGKHYVE